MIFKILMICAACLAVSAQAQNHDPATPPAVAAKVALRGDAIGVRVSEIRITRPNDILVVQADFGNAERTDRMVFTALSGSMPWATRSVMESPGNK